jgi:transposase-like protein
MSSILSAASFHSEEAAYAFVESKLWPNGPVCFHCGEAERISKMRGKSTRIGLYKCYACRKPFTVKMGTVLESSHVPMRMWLQAIYLLCSSKKGTSTRQLQRTFRVGLKTAWFLSHRVREAMKNLDIADTGPLGGENMVVEADESYVGGKARNRAYAPPPEKHAVFSLVERGGRVRSFHVPEVTGKTLKPILEAHMDRRTYLMTDDSTVYPPIVGDLAQYHGTVNHSAKEYVRAHFWHTNSAEGYFSILKRGIIGVYHHVSQQHLHRYLAEFDFRHNNRIRLGVDDVERTERAIKGLKGKRLTYQTTSREMSA